MFINYLSVPAFQVLEQDQTWLLQVCCSFSLLGGSTHYTLPQTSATQKKMEVYEDRSMLGHREKRGCINCSEKKEISLSPPNHNLALK